MIIKSKKVKESLGVKLAIILQSRNYTISLKDIRRID